MRINSLKRFTLSLAAALTAWLALANVAVAASEPDELVSKAQAAFRDFQNDPNMGWLRDHLSQAKAVMIAPEMRKAAFLIGGSGGRAVLLARDPNTGEWSGPAFYTIANASLGLQAGVEKSEVVMLIMTERGMTSLLKTQAKLGGDISIAVGPVGSGAERSITTDVVSFSRSKGIYGGINLKGTILKVSDERNEQYYGQKATPTDILVRHTAVNDRSDALKNQVARAAGESSVTQ
jgi:lipid-binding SYLF domain-containing protein